jgi:hypothetical protein
MLSVLFTVVCNIVFWLLAIGGILYLFQEVRSSLKK